jgi:DNA-binding NtrC family response regulator
MNANIQEAGVSALLVGEYDNDRGLVREVFRNFGWRLFEQRDCRRTLGWLRRNPVQVVIAECPSAGVGWQNLLEDLRDLPEPPQLVVASRTADDFLWSEVLNRGGYDVLPRPLNRDEVQRVVAAAGRHYCSMRGEMPQSAESANAA